MTIEEFKNLELDTTVVIIKTDEYLNEYHQYNVGDELQYVSNKITYGSKTYYSFVRIDNKNMHLCDFSEKIHEYIETKPKYREMRLKKLLDE